MKLLAVIADSGIVTFSDHTVTLPPLPSAAADLRALAARGEVFSLDSDDPVSLRLAVLVGEASPEPAELPAHRFQNIGGWFLLHLPSGKLVVAGQHTVDVEPGSYSLSVLGLADIDAKALDAELRPVLTPAEWRFRKLVERLSMAGCVPFLAAWILVLVYKLSLPSLIAAAAALALASPGFLLSRTRRYRATEERLRAHEEALPNYAIRLRRVTDTAGLSGGRLAL